MIDTPLRKRRTGAAFAVLGFLTIALVMAWMWASFAVARIDLSRLVEPSVVYAAPRVVEPGVSVTAIDLPGTLERLGYQQVTDTPHAPGQFRRSPGVWEIFIRASVEPQPKRPALPVRLDIRDDRIRAVVNVADGTPVGGVELEPEVLGNLDDLTHRLRRPVPLSSAPQHVIAAVLATEDRRFFDHAGVDPRSAVRAAWVNAKRGRVVEGGSTITQQLVKSLDSGAGGPWISKLRVALLAIALERRYSKTEILETYLNTVYLGQYGPLTMYGLGAAALTYFQKDVRALDLAEAATLAGMIRGPNRYSPVHSPYRTRARRNEVLRRMRDHDLITQAEFSEAAERSVAVQPTPPPLPLGPNFFDHVLAEVGQMRATTNVQTGGLRIYTSVDPVLQRTAEAVLGRKLEELEQRFPGLWHAEPARRLQGVLIALDPAAGEIRALVGGRDYWLSQFNRATHARRHPGSAFKPFVYLAGLRGGPRGERPSLTAASLLRDEPLTVQDLGQSWSPRKRRGFFLGQVTPREALAQSLNLATVWTAQTIGLNAVVQTARDVGFTSPMVPRPTLALGGVEVIPLELAAAYATLAHAGRPVAPTPISAVVDRSGSVTRPGRQLGRGGVSAAEAFLITHLLTSVMEDGTGAMARVLGVDGPVAGKTGSTDRDAWVVGYTPRLVTLVWVGFDNRNTLRLSGARGALPIWAAFMRAAMAVVPSGPFPVPPFVVFRDVDATTGKLATPVCRIVVREAFLQSTAPTAVCAEHRATVGARAVEPAAKLQ